MGNGGSSLKRKKGVDDGKVTVIIRHGGKFVMNPLPMYFGGFNSTLHGVNLKKDVSFEKLSKCCEKLGIIGAKNFYSIGRKSFNPLYDEDELLAWGWECSKQDRPMEICVEVLKPSVESSDDDDSNYKDSSSAESLNDEDDDMWKSSVDPDVAEAGSDQGDGDSEDEDEDVVCDESDFDEHRDSEEEGQNSEQPPIFNKEVIYNPEFAIEMTFESKELFKQAVTSHAINSKRSLYLKKNDKIRVYARCRGEGCEWSCTALKLIDKETWQIRSYNPEHSCAPTFHVTNLSSTWLGKKHLSDFQCDPKRSIKGWRKEVMRELNLSVSAQQAYRARSVAKNILQGEPDSQYTKLWDYGEEIRASNPGSTVVLDIDVDGKFSKFYVCFEAVKRGFKNGCRPYIGVDGCWLKGPRGGILLSAVGVDPDNCIYPLAYAIVSVENRETWEWFSVMLKVDLELGNGEGYTFMSDRQKGLIGALNDVFPNGEKRFCVRHMINNMVVAGFRGLTYKNAVYGLARASTVGVFNERMEAFKGLNQSTAKAAEWLCERDPANWSKAYFSTLSKCDSLLNNACESFNSSILDGRDKPVLTMLEWIRMWIMERFQTNRDRAERWKGRLPPKITKILRKKMAKMSDCIPMKASNTNYQIQCPDNSLYAVDLEKWTCSCRQWELSGIPCKHACSAISNQGGNPEWFVHGCLTVDTYKKAYEPVLLPIINQKEWDATHFIPPMPPNFGRSRGRPTKNRRVNAEEKSQKKQTKMKRQHRPHNCKQCGQTGHNKRKCKKKNVNAPSAVNEVNEPTGEVGASSAAAEVNDPPGEVGASSAAAEVNDQTVGSLFDDVIAPSDAAVVNDPTVGSLFDEVMVETQESAFSIPPQNLELNEEATRKKMMVRRSSEHSVSGNVAKEKVRWTKSMWIKARADRALELSGTGSNVAKVPSRGLIDEDNSHFDELLSQANNNFDGTWKPMSDATTLTGPTPWEQLHRDKPAQPPVLTSGPAMTFSSGGLRPMFSTQTRSMAKKISITAKGKEVAK